MAAPFWLIVGARKRGLPTPRLSKSINAAADFVAPQGISSLFFRPLLAALCGAGRPSISGRFMPRAPRGLSRRRPPQEIPNCTAYTRRSGPRPSGGNPIHSRGERVSRRLLWALRQADPSARAGGDSAAGIRISDSAESVRAGLENSRTRSSRQIPRGGATDNEVPGGYFGPPRVNTTDGCRGGFAKSPQQKRRSRLSL